LEPLVVPAADLPEEGEVAGTDRELGRRLDRYRARCLAMCTWSSPTARGGWASKLSAGSRYTIPARHGR
jgi:hypothetical protein